MFVVTDVQTNFTYCVHHSNFTENPIQFTRVLRTSGLYAKRTIQVHRCAFIHKNAKNFTNLAKFSLKALTKHKTITNYSNESGFSKNQRAWERYFQLNYKKMRNTI